MTSAARFKVLICDDIRDIRDMLRFTLRIRYDIVVARNGEEAWEIFNAEAPDLVFSDVVMPRIKGDDLLRRIKAHPVLGDTPVVLVTGATKDRELADAFWKKAVASDGFISKPFSPNEVLTLAMRLLEERRPRETPRRWNTGT